MDVKIDIIKKIPFALGNLGVNDENQKRMIENYITNLIITSSQELRKLTDKQYKKFLESL